MEATKRHTAAGQGLQIRKTSALAAPKGKAEAEELDTIDGVCISISARAAAIKRGAGVMIGDYFVGVTTGADLLFSHPAIVY